MSLRPLHKAPLLTLLNPGRRTPLLLVGASLGALLWGVAVMRAGLPLWGGVTIFLALTLVPVSLKWRDDLRRFGVAVMLLSVLLLLQGFHTAEHVVQAAQYYVFDWPPGRALGLLSGFNLEWVHFSWNWLVWGCTVFLFRRGLRGVWGGALMIWATAHSLEHTYLLVRYLQVVAELRSLGLPLFDAAQGLPGILGKNGLLAYSSLCGNIPGLTTAPRVAVHLVWNMGELALLILAANARLATLLPTGRRTRGGAPEQEVV